MNSLILRLAGLQSWGTSAAFDDRDTAPHPTRSALIGLFAATAGRPRTHVLAPHTDLPGKPTYQDLNLILRLDRPGTAYNDFHTIGGGRRSPHHRLRTSAGTHRTENRSTKITRRDYLADAVFILAVTGPSPLLARIAENLEQPHWAPYLGRRACIPHEPLVLKATPNDPLDELLHRTPLSLAKPPRPDQDRIPVAFVFDQPPARPADSVYELADHPTDYTPHHRGHLLSQRWSTTEQLPSALYTGPACLPALAAYMKEP